MSFKFWQAAAVIMVIYPAMGLSVTPESLISEIVSYSAPSGSKAYDYAQKAHNLIGKEKIDAAIEYCNKSIALNPTYGYPYGLRANCYFRKMDYTRAVADCNQALVLDPKDTVSLVLRARTYARLTKVDKALADCEAAIKINPDMADAYGCKGFVRLMQHQAKDAIKPLTKAIKLDPTQSNFFMWRAHAYQQLEQLDKAKTDAAKAKELMPDYIYIDLLIANLNSATGEYKKAFDVVDKLVSKSPNDIFALNAKAYMLSTTPDKKYRDGKEAVRLAEKALKISPDNSAIMDTLACAYAENGQFDKAVALAEKLVKKRKNDECLTTHLELFKKGKPYHEKGIN